jgi:hypothetical protein
MLRSFGPSEMRGDLRTPVEPRSPGCADEKPQVHAADLGYTDRTVRPG